jgi:ATP-binding cassette subfamily B protein
VLRGVSLTVPPGSSLAIVGGSGSGKSTVLKLVTRLYDATAGDIKASARARARTHTRAHGRWI